MIGKQQIIRLALSGCLLLGASFLNSRAQAQTLLSYKFRQGQTLKYALEQKMDIGGLMGGPMTSVLTFELTWSVETVDKNGKAKITQRIERVKYNAGSPA